LAQPGRGDFAPSFGGHPHGHRQIAGDGVDGPATRITPPERPPPTVPATSVMFLDDTILDAEDEFADGTRAQAHRAAAA
jgi:hypothetical protein